MAILNADFDFETQTSAETKAAFKGHPTKTLFHASMEFYRLLTTENARTGERGNEIFRSPWWFTREAFHRLAQRATPDFSIGTVARIRLAIPPRFNSKVEAVALVYLTQPVYGWVGIAERQPAGGLGSIYLGGGEEQVFLPNLADNSGMGSEYARMRSFAWLA